MNNIKENKQKNQEKIHNIGITEDKITSRAGISLFLRFVENTNIINCMSNTFLKLKKNNKGYKLNDMFKQLFSFFADGTSRHLSYFDHLKNDEGYASALETKFIDMCSSHQVKRFFNKFNFIEIFKFRNIFQKMFISLLNKKKPETIYIFMDTMILNNNDADVREGVEPTYKKVKGMQSFHFIWNNIVIDCVLRGGSKHCNNGNTVINAISHIVSRIRTEYDENAKIVFLFDSGFFSDETFEYLEKENIYYIAAAKMYKFAEKTILSLDKKEFSEYENDHIIWKYTDIEYKCRSWNKVRRAIYTVPMNNEKGQLLLDFKDNGRIIITNIEKNNTELFNIAYSYKLIELNHERGKYELTHRCIKDFGTEKLPFERFESNASFYNIMIISYNLFELFKQNCLLDIIGISKNSYPTTVRRIFIDIAGKIIKTSRKITLKFTVSTFKKLLLNRVWFKCNQVFLL